MRKEAASACWTADRGAYSLRVRLLGPDQMPQGGLKAEIDWRFHGFRWNRRQAADDVAQFAAWLKSNRGKVAYASFSPGTPSHFLGYQLNERLAAEMVHVPYKGAGPATIAVIRPAAAPAPDEIPNPRASGSATMPTVTPASRSRRQLFGTSR